MLHRIDDWLIDKLFQRIADALERWTSCYGIAAFLLTGAVGIDLSCYWIDRDWLGIGCLIFVAWLIIRAYMLDRRAPANVMPTDRVHWFVLRAVLLVFLILILPFDGIVFLDGFADLRFALVKAASWLIQAALYFLACRKRPPRRQEARTPCVASARAM